MWYIILNLVALLCLVSAQFPEPPKYDKIIDSTIYPGSQLRYKLVPSSICETTANVRSWSGYLSIPPDGLKHLGIPNGYPINLFFWLFESRTKRADAPVTLWLGGGPGESSLKGLFHGIGPCSVNDDSRSIRLNPHSWNEASHLLVLDQPAQTGFSYDILQNVTHSYLHSGPSARPYTPDEDTRSVPGVYPGVGPSHDAFQTANTTGIMARTVWQALQIFSKHFEPLTFSNDELSIWSTGYGGRFAASFGAFFERQREKGGAGVVPIKIRGVGIVNGL